MEQWTRWTSKPPGQRTRGPPGQQTSGPGGPANHWVSARACAAEVERTEAGFSPDKKDRKTQESLRNRLYEVKVSEMGEEQEKEAETCTAIATAGSRRDAAAQVLHHRIRSFGHDRCSRSAERIPFQTETPAGQDHST